MFCPKCGQQNTETVRFCTRCGFRLVAVKQLLADDGVLSPVEPEVLHPRRKDLNLGALLMYFGSLLALFVGVFYGGGQEKGGMDALFALPAAVMWTSVVNAVMFVALLLGGRFSKRQKDLSLGAMLMFVFSMLATFTVPAFELGGVDNVLKYGKAELLILTAGLAALFWIGQPLMQLLLRGLFNLFSADTAPAKPAFAPAPAQATLPPVQSVPIDSSVEQTAVTTAKMAVPSVTEDSTQLLGKDLEMKGNP